MSGKPADDGKTVLVAGGGVKLSRSLIKAWKKRYFVLRTAAAHEAHTHVIEYYESVEQAASGDAPEGTVLLTRGKTRVKGRMRRNKEPSLLVSTPGQRDFDFAPEDARHTEWLRALLALQVTDSASAPAAAAGAVTSMAFDAAEWPLLAAVLERSAADADAAPQMPPPHRAKASLVSSWPPEEGTQPSLEATVRAVAGEAATLRVTRPDDPGVRRAVEAADRAEASVGATASSEGVGAGADAAEPGRDVAAAVLSLQGVDWEGRVEKAMGKIDAQGAEFEEEMRHLREHGSLPADVQKVALEQLLDAVGALAATAQVILPQAELEAKQRGHLSKETATMLRNELRKLPLTVGAIQRWGLEIPRRFLGIAERTLRSMPLAATDPSATVDGVEGGVTVQRVIGALVVAGGAAALNHVTWVDFTPGAEPLFAKVIDARGSFDEPTIRRPRAPGGANLATALRVYSERATAATATLVPKVLNDVAAYAAAKAEALSHPDARAALDELEALSKEVPQEALARLYGEDSEEEDLRRWRAKDGLKWATELIKRSDADAPPPTSLEHAVHKQKKAVAGSIGLYQLICDIARRVEGNELVVLPGGVKKLARTVFKSAVNYGCDLSRITDQVRCTVVASTLAGVAAALRGLMECEAVPVWRMKNRFALDYDATPAGGYLDLQMMVVFESEGGGWVMGEVQINLWSMLRIKENPEGGHKIFNFARAMRAYDEATFMHKGGFDDGVAARIAAGVLLVVRFQDEELRDRASASVALSKALASGKCRMRVLDMWGTKIGDSGATLLADALKRNTSVSKLDLGANAIGDSGAEAFADALRHNSSLSELNLGFNRIGELGVAALASALKSNTSVFQLVVRNNNVSANTLADLMSDVKSRVVTR